MAANAQLRRRWKTDDGKERLAKVIEALQKGEDWAPILKGFPCVEEVKNGRDLRVAELFEADLRGADFSGADLSGAHLRKADLSEADLFGANLTGAYLVGAEIMWADLREADLPRADLNEAHLAEANLNRADLRCARLNEADLRGAHLRWAHLGEADLFEADLRGADFSGAELNKANLSRTDLSGADLRRADLREADLEDAKVARVQINDRTMLLGADIRQANFSGDPVLKREMEDLQWLQGWKAKRWRNRKIYYPLWLVFCNCGRSFLLWAFWSVLFALSFGTVYCLYGNCFTSGPGRTLADAHQFMPFYYSIVTFTTLGFGDVTPKPDDGWMQGVVAFEVILGYIMLGGLISILATKLARRS